MENAQTKSWKANSIVTRVPLRIVGFFFIMLFYTSINAQTNSNNISLDIKNATIESILDIIEERTEFRFLYSKDIIDVNNILNITVKDESITNVLNKIFKNTDIIYTVRDKQIVLSHKNKAKSDDRHTITGQIFDKEGESLPGVAVSVVGTTTGTITDLDGKFEIIVPDNFTLKVSYIGFKSQTFVIKGPSHLKITMDDNLQSLDEVIVIGYGATSRKNLTTSISTIKPENINKSAVSNMSSLLLGRASGLQATVASSQPDGKVDVSIRGAGTPLYIVDGIMMPSGALEAGSGNAKVPSAINRSGLSGINPSDIESIEVLKDASAAIYGIGAANGVILITTKKGKSGKPTITYEGSYSHITNQRTLKALNANQYMRVANVFEKEQYLYNNAMYPYGDNSYDGRWTPKYSNDRIANNTIDTDWVGLILRDGYINNQNITVSGGSDKIRYYLGLNYFDQQATVHNSDMQRYIIRSNVSAKLFPFLELTTTVNYNKNDYTNSTIGTDPAGGHTYGAYAAAITYPPLLSITKEDGSFSTHANIANPKALEKISDLTETNTIYTNFAIDIDILKDVLTSRLIYGMNKENSNRSLYIPSDVYYNEMYRSRGNIGNTSRTYQTFEATVNFRKDFFNVVNVDVVAGMGRYLTSGYGSNIYYEDINDRIGNDKIELSGGPYYPSSHKSKSERRSQFVRGTFDFLDRYVASVAFRRDGTDKFFPGQKYVIFPSVSLAWKISNEKFMKDISFVNLLKLRLSYGKTGRDNIGESLYGLYAASNYRKFDSGNTQYIPYVLTGLDYDDVSWEKTTLKNLGLDFSILNDRIWGSADIFRNDETELLRYDPESWLSMFGTRPKNGGHYKRVGLDININSRNIKTKEFEWVTLLNLSRSQNLWVERAENYDYSIFQRRKNEPVNNYYYYKHSGIINSDRSNMPESQKSLPASAQMPGYPIVVDRNNDGIINEDDIHMDNDGDPKLYAGLGNTFYYKNFDLDIFMYGRFGIRKWNPGVSYGNAVSVLTHDRNIGLSVYDMYNSQVNPNGKRFGIAYSKGPSLPGGKGLDMDVYDASFLRIRNVTLGYNFNRKVLGALGNFINSIRVYVDVQNPFTFTEYPIVDPEIITGGGQSSKASYPQTRTFSMGAKLVF